MKLHTQLFTAMILAGLAAPLYAGSNSSANKVSVGASNEMIQTEAECNTSGYGWCWTNADAALPTVLQTKFKSATNKSYQISLQAECSLMADFELTDATYSSTRFSEMIVWVEIDNNDGNWRPIPVVPGQTSSTYLGAVAKSRVTLCDNWVDYRIRTSNPSSTYTDLDYFNATKSTHGFNWVAYNVPQGIHNIRIKAALLSMTGFLFDFFEMPGATAVGIGKRTVIVEPINAYIGSTAVPEL